MIKGKKTIFWIGIVLFLSIQAIGQQKWSSINFKEKFKDSLLVNDHFIYSSFIFKDEKGNWQSALSDENGEMILDTTLYLIGSNCVVDNGDPHFLDFCDCSYNNDSLFVSIYNNNPAYSDVITIVCTKSKFSSAYKANYPSYYPGQKYVWEILNQKLKLSTSQFQKGRWLNGFINLDIQEFFKSKTYPLTLSRIRVKGFFKCILK